ncbi:MAG: capsule assembly Wzi family protein, partial [Imperialibacter sp.]
MRNFTFCIAFYSIHNFQLYGQSLPIGIPVFEESFRRAQLLGLTDSAHSLMVRPLHPLSMGLQDSGYQLYPQDSVKKNLSSMSFLKGKGKLALLLPSYQFQFNTRHPYGWGDGAMIPNRGYQHLIGAGLYGKVGPLHIQLRPEWIYAENKAFEGFSSTFPQEVQDVRYHHWVSADPAERFGLSRYSRMLPGQSSVALHFGPVRVGGGNENIWWGPGQFNSLTFSNNSRPFEHLTLATSRPVRTWVGNFEGQLLMGRLQPPDFQPIYGNGITISKKTDWRYLSAIMLSYNPKWVKGLFMGAARTFQQYSENLTPSFGGYFPVFQAFQKETVGLSVDDLYQDQQIAVFLRWLFQKAHAEVYFEFGRRDHALNWRDFMMSPEHARACLFGFSKLFRIKKDRK